MPITNRAEAKEGGFAQVREALTAFEGDVVAQDARGNKTEFGLWGGGGIGKDGKPLPPKEFLQIVCVNVVPIEVTEELSMPITEGWTFRINCSDFKGSFWIDKFLESAEKFKILVPEGLVGKRITFRRVTLKATKRDGTPQPEFDSTNYIIEKVGASSGATAAPVVAPQTASPAAAQQAQPPSEDPMAVALELAIGKTEAQFRSAIALHPVFANSPLLALAKAGAVTQTLVNEGKIKLVTKGNKQVYEKG